MKYKALLAALLLAWLLPLGSNAATASTAGLTADQELRLDQTLEIGVEITAGQGSYHAYDLELSYDTGKLTLVSCTQDGGTPEHWEKNGTIRVLGYGEAKTGAVKLTFRPLAAGTAEIRLNSAKVDNRAGAPSRDAPAATITRGTCRVTIRQEYGVTLDTGLTADSLVARSGEDYTFRPTDSGNYTYAPKATVAGKSVTVTPNADGSYVIPGAQITGPITITANRVAKSYRVTFTGSGATGEATAVYGTDYSFTVAPQTGKKYTVKINMGSKAYTGFTQSGNSFTIPGADITDHLLITVTYTATSGTSTGTSSGTSTGTSTGTSSGTSSGSGRTVSFQGTGAADATGAARTTAGKDYSFTLSPKKGYDYDVTVRIGENPVAYTQDGETNTYTVPAAGITGNLTITVTKTPRPQVNVYLTLDRRYMYLVTFDGEMGSNQVPLYEGQPMLETPRYQGYGWLVVSTQELEDFALAAKYAITLGTGASGGKTVDTGDIDLSGRLDRQDGALTQEMYNARYLLTDMEMRKFLNADMNADRKLDTQDAAAVIFTMLEKGEVP